MVKRSVSQMGLFNHIVNYISSNFRDFSIIKKKFISITLQFYKKSQLSLQLSFLIFFIIKKCFKIVENANKFCAFIFYRKIEISKITFLPAESSCERNFNDI